MVTYQLIDKKVDAGSFFLNADGTKDTEKKLDFTNSYGVLNPYYVIGKDGARTHFRYIQGCKIYDPAEQDKQKIIFNMTTGLVQFEKGAPIVLDEEKGKVLMVWMDGHPNNENSPNHDPNIHEPMFRKLDPKAILQKEMDEVSVADEAMDMLRLLRKSPERMRSVAIVFTHTANLSGDEEIYLGLRKVAMEQPEAFINSIANKENEVLSDVLKSMKYGIINKDAKGYFYEADKAVLFATPDKGKVADNQLVSFLMTKPGDIHYRQMLIKLQQTEIELNQPEH